MQDVLLEKSERRQIFWDGRRSTPGALVRGRNGEAVKAPTNRVPITQPYTPEPYRLQCANLVSESQVRHRSDTIGRIAVRTVTSPPPGENNLRANGERL